MLVLLSGCFHALHRWVPAALAECQRCRCVAAGVGAFSLLVTSTVYRCCRCVADELAAFSPLIAKAQLASDSLGTGITQDFAVGVAAGGGITGMADTWSNAQAYCNVRGVPCQRPYCLPCRRRTINCRSCPHGQSRRASQQIKCAYLAAKGYVR